jgi:hypothetical protein
MRKGDAGGAGFGPLAEVPSCDSPRAMKRRPWIRYVHWLGYVTTVIVALQLLFIAYFGVSAWKMRADRREATRMQQGAVMPRLAVGYGSGEEMGLLAQLPPLEDLGVDGFRFVAMPSLGDTNFAIAIHRTPAGGEGTVLMVPRNGTDGLDQTISIRLSRSDYDRLVARMDELAARWEGDSGWSTDGTVVVLERVRNAQVTSGFGNSPDFYEKIGAVVFEALRPAVPQLARFDSSWHSKDR